MFNLIRSTAESHVLVEDNPRYLKQLEKSLARFGYQHLDTAHDAAEASEKLAASKNLKDDRVYEIIIADMRLRDDKVKIICYEIITFNLMIPMLIHALNWNSLPHQSV